MADAPEKRTGVADQDSLLLATRLCQKEFATSGVGLTLLGQSWNFFILVSRAMEGPSARDEWCRAKRVEMKTRRHIGHPLQRACSACSCAFRCIVVLQLTSNPVFAGPLLLWAGSCALRPPKQGRPAFGHSDPRSRPGPPGCLSLWRFRHRLLFPVL